MNRKEVAELERAAQYFCLTSSGKVFQGPDWWMFLSIEHDLIDYYRWQCRTYGLHVLKGAKSGPHISIVRGERPQEHFNWKRLLNKDFDFRYSNQLRWNDEHIWLDVDPAFPNKIRTQLGLRTFPSFHLTVGRFRDKV